MSQGCSEGLSTLPEVTLLVTVQWVGFRWAGPKAYGVPPATLTSTAMYQLGVLGDPIHSHMVGLSRDHSTAQGILVYNIVITAYCVRRALELLGRESLCK